PARCVVERGLAVRRRARGAAHKGNVIQSQESRKERLSFMDTIDTIGDTSGIDRAGSSVSDLITKGAGREAIGAVTGDAVTGGLFSAVGGLDRTSARFRFMSAWHASCHGPSAQEDTMIRRRSLTSLLLPALLSACGVGAADVAPSELSTDIICTIVNP